MFSSLPLPLLVVFGLDFTLWPFHSHYTVSPLSQNSSGIFDASGVSVNCYSDVPSIFQELQKQGIQIAVGSQAGYEGIGHLLLNLLKVDQFITTKELYRGVEDESYYDMFERIKLKTKTAYSDMLFFDTYDHNVRIMNKVGVYGIPVRDGMNLKVLEAGIKRYQSWKKRK